MHQSSLWNFEDGFIAAFVTKQLGVINGSLWSITVELLFYVSVPLIVLLERRVKRTVFWLILISFTIYLFGPNLLTLKIYREKSIYDGLKLTPIVWGWMFGFGILCAKHFKTLQNYLKYALGLVIPLVAMMVIGEGPIFGSRDNCIGIVYFICYTGIILWVAFYIPYIRLPFDISYGTYIWHMPIINFMLLKSMTNIITSFVGTAIFAAASWYFIEKPILGFKKKSLQRIQRTC